MCIYLTSYYIFSVSASVMFNENESYFDLSTTLLTMISSGLGQFEFNFTGLGPRKKIFAEIYLVIYIVFQVIFLLNFVIAILSNTFEKLSTKANSLYLREVIILRHKLEHSIIFSSLVSTFVPLNILAVPLFFI
jgi:hypothetical protein